MKICSMGQLRTVIKWKILAIGCKQGGALTCLNPGIPPRSASGRRRSFEVPEKHGARSRRQRYCRSAAKPLHRGFDHQRRPRADRPWRAGRQQHFGSSALVSSGCNPDPHAGAGCSGCIGEPGRAGVDLATARPPRGQMAPTRDFIPPAAVRTFAGSFGGAYAGSGWG